MSKGIEIKIGDSSKWDHRILVSTTDAIREIAQELFRRLNYTGEYPKVNLNLQDTIVDRNRFFVYNDIANSRIYLNALGCQARFKKQDISIPVATSYYFAYCLSVFVKSRLNDKLAPKIRIKNIASDINTHRVCSDLTESILHYLFEIRVRIP